MINPVKKRINQEGSFAITIMVIALIFCLAAIFISIRLNTKKDSQIKVVTSEVNYPLLGFSISPKEYTANGLEDYFQRAKQLGGIVTWAGDWGELEKQNSGAGMLFKNYNKYEYLPVMIVTAYSDNGSGGLDPIREITESVKDSYIANIKKYAGDYKPNYIGIGIEVNRIFETSPAQYQDFVKLFDASVDAVHSVSPTTKVFTTFQYERLKGLKGGLFGGANNEQVNDLSLLNDFQKADLLAFTTYPSLVYKLPSEIPDSYYMDIPKYTSKPISVSEMGWPSGQVANGWNSTPELQLEYVERFKTLTKEINLQFAIWSFMYDPESPVPFSSMGLIDSTSGNYRPAYDSYTGINVK